MIEYDAGYWGIGFIWQLKGSVLPRAICWALPSAVSSAVLHTIIRHVMQERNFEDSGLTYGMSGYTMVLGFLLVFRTREAYNRWWEAIGLLQTTRGEWFSAYSSLLSFCSRDPSKKHDVDKFQHLLVRLMSLLYGSALDQVSTVVGATFEIIDLSGFDSHHLEFLAKQDNKMDIVVQWIQQLIVNKHKEGVLQIDAPILSRVFQELSRGKVNISNARKVSEFPFPFPYAQLLAEALLIQWLITPVLMCILCDDPFWAAALAFNTNLFMWSINYVGEEIEEPFGDDDNDLPLEQMQRSYNLALVSLLSTRAQSAPVFNFDEAHRILRVTAFGSGLDDVFVMPGTATAHKTSRVLRKQDTRRVSAEDDTKTRSSKRISAIRLSGFWSQGEGYTASTDSAQSPVGYTASDESITDIRLSLGSDAKPMKAGKKKRGFQHEANSSFDQANMEIAAHLASEVLENERLSRLTGSAQLGPLSSARHGSRIDPIEEGNEIPYPVPEEDHCFIESTRRNSREEF